MVIGKRVEIGAHTCVDRGSWRNTTIGDDCKLDNLVQIAHNVVLGQGCIVCAQSGVAGSSELGEFVVVGGQAGIKDHVRVGTGARIAAKSGVINDLPGGADYAGMPAVPAMQWRRQQKNLCRANKRK